MTNPQFTPSERFEIQKWLDDLRKELSMPKWARDNDPWGCGKILANELETRIRILEKIKE